MNVEDIQEFPDKVFHLNENGTFRNNIRPNVKMSVQQYWGTQSRKIGLIVTLSMVVLIMILLAESNVLGAMWKGVLNVISFIINIYMGLFV